MARRLRDKQARGEPITIENFVIDTINNKSDRNYRGKCLGSLVTSYGQEPITRSLQLTHSLVTAFSQTDLFLV